MTDLASLLKAAADPNRLRILRALRDGELCVCHLVAYLRLAQPTVSRHVDILRKAGLIATRKEARWVHCERLTAPRTEARLLYRLIDGAVPADGADARRLRRVREADRADICRTQRQGRSQGRSQRS